MEEEGQWDQGLFLSSAKYLYIFIFKWTTLAFVQNFIPSISMRCSYYTNEEVARSVGDWAEKDFKRWCGQIMKGILVVGGHSRTPSEHRRGTLEQGHRALT